MFTLNYSTIVSTTRNNKLKNQTMTTDNLLQDVPKEQRYKALAEMATKSETDKVIRHYSEDEKMQMKEFAADEGIVLMDKEDEFSEIKKQFNAAVKVAREAIRGALKNIKKGYAETEETVFMIDDQETGLMHIYDGEGIYLKSRKLYSDERQTKIIELNQKAS